MAIIGFIVFAGALALSIAVIALMVVPQWQRIALLAMGNMETGFAPLERLAVAERRIAVRRWAAQPIPPAFIRLREAA
ncbi:hypothetical protein [Sphingomonas bacterium]|uniref:hypothetical protein n=1 Tax=Sphingomonas bacterium TaxID=1895847 RepID=UPI001576F7BF|nr:hypothetical protein [Sphingomonas bacterium]